VEKTKPQTGSPKEDTRFDEQKELLEEIRGLLASRRSKQRTRETLGSPENMKRDLLVEPKPHTRKRSGAFSGKRGGTEAKWSKTRLGGKAAGAMTKGKILGWWDNEITKSKEGAAGNVTR